jgi:Domain of unknown function (DUF4214)
MSDMELSAKARQYLLDLDETDFIWACYRMLLNRKPDVDGFRCYLSRLGSGSSKEEIIRALLESEEFERNRTRHLGQPFGFVEPAPPKDRFSRALLDSAASIVAPDLLSKQARLRLLELDANPFILTCFKIVLGREPEVNEFNYRLALLESGSTKEEILELFLDSEEFRRNRVRFLAQISELLEAAGTLDFSSRELLDSTAFLVEPGNMNLILHH